MKTHMTHAEMSLVARKKRTYVRLIRQRSIAAQHKDDGHGRF